MPSRGNPVCTTLTPIAEEVPNHLLHRLVAGRVRPRLVNTDLTLKTAAETALHTDDS
jgi:hypothetical protein